jgi:hypothetical protein
MIFSENRFPLIGDHALPDARRLLLKSWAQCPIFTVLVTTAMADRNA